MYKGFRFLRLYLSATATAGVMPAPVQMSRTDAATFVGWFGCRVMSWCRVLIRDTGVRKTKTASRDIMKKTKNEQQQQGNMHRQVSRQQSSSTKKQRRKQRPAVERSGRHVSRGKEAKEEGREELHRLLYISKTENAPRNQRKPYQFFRYRSGGASTVSVS